MDRENEWLETNGLGSFAMGTSTGIPRRRYHSLLIAATNPPTGRVALLNQVEVFLSINNERYPLSSFLFAPGVTHPQDSEFRKSFSQLPWPTWTFQFPDGSIITAELFMPYGEQRVCLSWKLKSRPKKANVKALLQVRPLLGARDYHALQHANDSISQAYETVGKDILWQTYKGLPALQVSSSAMYVHGPQWYNQFLYSEERARGFDHTEDLFSPGTFNFDILNEDAWMIFSAVPSSAKAQSSRSTQFETIRSAELERREKFDSNLKRAAQSYIVKRGDGLTIMAGYPWFTDWGRDTFISIRGLCLATGQVKEAAQILTRWADSLSQGMMPNRFPDLGEAPEYNSVDSSLWFIIAVYELLSVLKEKHPTLYKKTSPILLEAVIEILESYSIGTRFGIRMAHDGLLAAGVPGQQLTWMDARIGERVVTPRIGKPVEIQALWLNALHVGSEILAENEAQKWAEILRRAQRSFEERFWNAEAECLYDVVDVDHHPGTYDARIRPNQILALGGLPLIVLKDKIKAAKVLEVVTRELLTPFGLRTLAAWDPEYRGHYEGGPAERDGAYHQGTVWPWLIGPYVEAWLRINGGTSSAKKSAREKFLNPLIRQLDNAGVGHLSEIFDAEPPFTPRGCPFQAWSLGEVLRLDKVVLS